jgi:predicted Rossmann-fold nucleotide-binding protein
MFLVCSVGGSGLAEASNRGELDENGKSVGLNIGLPLEELPNPYITPELAFQFHNFFMRKFWFAYLAKVVMFFPGGLKP